MIKVNNQIKDNYIVYYSLLSGEKIIDHGEIIIMPGTRSQKKYNRGAGTIRYLNNSEIGQLIVRQPKDSQLDFGFSLFAQSFEKPIMRFDADGPVHTNADDSLSIEERVVKTPHFHYYDKRGIEMAFRPKELEKNEYIISNDIAVAFKYFCKEANIQSLDNSELGISLQLELFAQEVSTDLNKGVSFP